MAKVNMQKTIIGVIALSLGIFFFFGAYTEAENNCGSQDITQTVGDQELKIEQPKEFSLLICLTAVKKAALYSILGIALLFVSIPLFIKGVAGE